MHARRGRGKPVPFSRSPGLRPLTAPHPAPTRRGPRAGKGQPTARHRSPSSTLDDQVPGDQKRPTRWVQPWHWAPHSDTRAPPGDGRRRKSLSGPQGDKTGSPGARALVHCPSPQQRLPRGRQRDRRELNRVGGWGVAGPRGWTVAGGSGSGPGPHLCPLGCGPLGWTVAGGSGSGLRPPLPPRMRPKPQLGWQGAEAPTEQRVVRCHGPRETPPPHPPSLQKPWSPAPTAPTSHALSKTQGDPGGRGPLWEGWSS